jgi:cytosine/adenosine deaminase-related metal-dependent hydrolase
VALVIKNATVVTMNPVREVLRGAQVRVEAGRIAELGPRVRRPVGVEVLDVEGAALVPGLIHGHLHACQTLFRNQAEGLELMDWLRERIWPLEAAHDAASVRASADLTFLELIRSGATAALDMGTVHHTDEIFRSAARAGFRLTSGKAMMDAGQGLPAGLRESTEASLAESERLLRDWDGREGGRLRYAFAPRFALSTTPELLRRVGELAPQRNVRIHSHASENAEECDCIRQKFGQDTVVYLHELGVSGPNVTLAHCVWLTAGEQRVLRETGTVVCHCPSSNLKLGSGIAKVPELLQDGIPVALGADGAPCNNTLDLFQEMRLASLLQRPRAGPQALPAMQVLSMATLGGARALGLEDELGSIQVGKRADLAVVQLEGPHLLPPSEDVAIQLVHCARAEDVRHVLIDGQMVMRDRHVLTLDEETVLRRAKAQWKRLQGRAALQS